MAASWKKVLVSGSRADVPAVKVDNLTNGYAVIGGGNTTDLSSRAISGSGAILANGASGIQLTGSFSGSFNGSATLTGSFTGSFFGNGTGLTGIQATSLANSLTPGLGLSGSTFNGTAPATFSISGSSQLTSNFLTKWTGTGLNNALIYDDGTNLQITGSTIIVSGASTAFIVTGSVRASAGFTGSLFGTASWASNAISALTASYLNNLNQNLSITGSLILSGSTGAELIVLGETQFTGSVGSTGGFTGSLFGTSSWASQAQTASFVTASNVWGPFGSNSIISSSYAVTSSYALTGQLTNALTQGALITNFSYNGSAANVTVAVATSSLVANQIPKFSSNTLSGSNIVDTGAQVQISATATSGLSVGAGGINVTGNSTFVNSVRINGDLNVAGTASFENTQNLFVADKFILLASGSPSLTDGGIIVSGPNGNSGSAWYLETTSTGNYGRWATSVNLNASASDGTVSEYAVTVNVAASSDPSQAVPPTWGGGTNGSGNMWINNTSGDIFIYA